MFGKNKVVTIRWDAERGMFYAELPNETIYCSNRLALKEDLKKLHGITKTKLSSSAGKVHALGTGWID